MKTLLISLLAILPPSMSYALDDMQRTAVIGVDNVLCGIVTPSQEVQLSLIRASQQTGLSINGVLWRANDIGNAVMGQLVDSGRAAAYCNIRRMK